MPCGLSALALAFLGLPPSPLPLLPAQTEEPQIVVLPPEPEGLAPQASLDAWKVIVQEVTKAKGKLKVSLKLQKEIHDLLIGPAREQARDCGMNTDCLKEIGSALDAKLLVAGRVNKEEVSLVAIDVASGRAVGAGKSPANFAGGKLEAKAKGATQALVAAMSKKGAPPADTKAAEVPKGGEPRPPEPRSETKTAEVKATPAGEKGKEPPPAAAEVPPPPEPPRPVSEAEVGEYRAESIGTASPPAEERLKDDPPPPPPPGPVATAQPASEPAPTALAAPPPPPAEPVTEQWWFWAGIGLAVVAGGATAVALAGGLKGGPDIPSDEGTIEGRY